MAGAASIGSMLENKVLKKMTAGSMIGIGLNTYFTVDQYKTSRSEGNGRLMSGAKAVGENVMMEAMGLPGYLGYQALTGLPKVGVQVAEGLSKQSRSMVNFGGNAPFKNATFADSQQAYTMRQAGMQMAKQSKFNIQQTMLGNEAAAMHR